MKVPGAILVPALGALISCAALWQYYVRSQDIPIQQLAGMAAGSEVHLEGAVIALDAANSQFWIQDRSGTLPIPVNPGLAGVRVGDIVFLDATVSGSRDQSGAIESGPGKSRSSDHVRGSSGPGSNAGADQLWLSNSVPTITLTVSRVLRSDTRWVLFPSLSLVFLYMLRRRGRQQKEKLSAVADELHRAQETASAVRELSSAVQTLNREGTFNSQVPVPVQAELAPLGTGINELVAEIQQRERMGKDAESRLDKMTLIDDLTGLPNRRLLSDRLSQSITKAQRDASLFALLHIDLDGFKLVNDSFGHALGDVLLSKVAQRLRMRYRQSDTLARIGGDEFALILDRIQERSDAQKAAENVLEVLKAPFALNGHSIQVTASVGISIFPDGHDYGQLLQQADCAMYAAKRSGKSRIVQYSDDLGSAARERLTLEGALQHAIARGEISINYQPEFDLATNQIVRFEALARWTHPSLGRVGPLSFIPVAEESGLIVSLGAYIMERACTEARAWQEIAKRPIQVAVNVSTVQFSQDSFFEDVAGILHRTGLHPSLLQLELTESATLAGVERATEMMKRFSRMGVTVAVDDFGTGYSCLTYLPKLAFDVLKLDRSFVNGLMVKRETRSFVESIITLAHNLKMKVVVEGVETDDQLRLIRTLGADEAQGHLLGEPSGEPMALLLAEGDGGKRNESRAASQVTASATGEGPMESVEAAHEAKVIQMDVSRRD